MADKDIWLVARGSLNLTKEQWFGLPLALREEWWRATENGTKQPSKELEDKIRAAL